MIISLMLILLTFCNFYNFWTINSFQWYHLDKSRFIKTNRYLSRLFEKLWFITSLEWCETCFCRDLWIKSLDLMCWYLSNFYLEIYWFWSRLERVRKKSTKRTDVSRLILTRQCFLDSQYRCQTVEFRL